MTKTSRMGRISKKFDEELRRLSKTTEMPRSEVTNKILNTPEFMRIRMKLVSEKKGSPFDLFVIMVVAFVFLVFFVGLFYGLGMFTSTLSDVLSTANLGGNVSTTTNTVINDFNVGLSVWYWGFGFIMIVMFLAFLITNFLVETHPVFMVVYIFVLIFAVVVAAMLSNAYEASILGSPVIGAMAQNFAISNIIFLYLPIWVTIFGFIGGILLFINIRNSGGGG